jgi:hypothetical protein
MEKYRFMSIDWVEMARREITQLLATKDLAGIQFTLCEEFTEPPSDLRRDGAATIGFYVRVDNGRVEIGDRPIDNADLKFVSTYDDALAIARDPDAPTAQPSEIEERIAAGTLKIEGDPSKAPAVLQEVDIHRLLASRTA